MSGHTVNPKWIYQDPYAPGVSKSMKRNIIYYRQLVKATPKWIDHEKVRIIYKKAKERKLVVDHIVPLNSPIVCGLHCEQNLEGITYAENESKSNYWWPDMPNEQQDLFGIEDKEQYHLF